MKISADQIMAWGPCEAYPRKRIEKLWEGRESLTLREIAALDIPPPDVWWPLLEAASEAQCRHLACWCALQVLPEDAPQIVRRYLETEDELIRFEAKRAARSVSLYAAEDSARDSAKDAAYSAACHVAYHPAMTRNAVWEAIWKHQIDYAITYLEGETK